MMASLTSDLQHAVGAAGPLAPATFVVLYVLLTVLLVPGSVPTVAAGALFGAVWGSVLTVVGATLGASAAFLLARHAGRAAVAPRLGARGRRVDAWLARHGFLAVLLVRLVPLAPFNVVNYAAGVSGVSARSYVLATAVGIVPGTVAFVVLGSAVSRPGSAAFVGSLAAVAVLSLGGWVAGRRLRRAQAASAANRGASAAVEMT